MKKYFIICATILGLSTDQSHAISEVSTQLPGAAHGDEAQSEEAHSSSRRHFAKLTEATVQVRTQFGYGTGTLVRHDGKYYVITAAHVIRGLMDEIIPARVIFDDSQIETSVAYVSENSDLAILSVESIPGRDAYPLRFHRGSVAVGERTAYCGYPNRPDLACFEGTVSQVSEQYINVHSYAFGGASGSLVVDGRGRIVGVLTALEVGGWFGRPQPLEDVVWVTPVSRDILEQL